MKPFYLILTLIPALLIGRTVSAQISVDEVDAGEESVTFQDKLKSIPVDVDYFSRARYKAERAAIRKERNYLEFNSGVQGLSCRARLPRTTTLGSRCRAVTTPSRLRR